MRCLICVSLGDVWGTVDHFDSYLTLGLGRIAGYEAFDLARFHTSQEGSGDPFQFKFIPLDEQEDGHERGNQA